MINKVELIHFPKKEDPRGNLTYIQEKQQIPFEIERVYWIYDVPGGQVRGGHAFKKQMEVIVALSGSFDVLVKDGSTEKTFSLNRSYEGLYISNGLWRQMENFSTNAVAMVLSSTKYSVKDYIRTYKEYLDFCANE